MFIHSKVAIAVAVATLAGWIPVPVMAQNATAVAPTNVSANLAGQGQTEAPGQGPQDEEVEYEGTGISGKMDCAANLRHFDPLLHKEVYTIGVHAPGGEDTAWREFNMTFQDYLTATAGRRFDPPIKFRMVATATPLLHWVDEGEEVDFVYSDTGVYSCIGVEMGAQPVATTVSHAEVRGHDFDLDMFGGIMFTRADRIGIDSVEDLKDVVIGALAISDFAGGQAQFYIMHEYGLDYIVDPKQVIFTDNQYDIVTGVLNGDWDVGFVRTGMIERMTDEDGKLLDETLFKVLNPKIYVMDDGNLFPFLHSTPVFPEWPFAAVDGVNSDVIEEVQDALIKMMDHLSVGVKINSCREDLCEVEDCADGETPEVCKTGPPSFFDDHARCETTRELALLAAAAGNAAHFDGFRPPRSHFHLRTMQEAAGFLQRNELGEWKCTRAKKLYEGINCPAGYYKLPKGEFDKSCEKAGLPCPEGYSCYCKPCVEAHEVDVWAYKDESGVVTEAQGGCDKMSLCGTVEQTKTITLRVKDNMEREDPEVTAVMHVGQSSLPLTVAPAANLSYIYEFNYSDSEVRVGILEIYFDGVQIPDSPFRVQVIDRNCDIDYPGQGKDATAFGECACGSGTLELNGKCMSTGVFAGILSAVLLFVAFQFGYFYLRYRRMKNDEMWLINVEELHFGDPVEVVGQGSFGVVLLAEYRGTKVAIKRAIPPSRSSGSRTNGSGMLGCGSCSGSKDLEAGSVDVDARENKGQDTVSKESAASQSLDFDLLGDNLFQSQSGKGCPAFFGLGDEHTKLKTSILGNQASRSSRQSMRAVFCPWFDRASRQKEAFLEEMRLLSRLRHPCITTVMGAVVSSGQDPMLVMEYMEYGSLHDLIHSESMFFSGEIILQIVRDIAQGLRYLHASKPPILHGDLKARNILCDSRFRAKVCDFGLSTKKKNGISGTPFWLAPEYLRGKTEYNPACDMYSVGIIFYEIYARKNPYEGEKFRTVLRNVCNPRKNYRPEIPAACPPKMLALMKKLWSPDPFFRPQAKDLDMSLMELSVRDAEPVVAKEEFAPTIDMFDALFPKHIAEALKHGQKVEPEQHDMVTVVFAEVVHFQEITRSIPTLKVTNLLDRLFFALDALAKKHNVFKVETVGETYMGVTNLEGDQDNTHVRDIAHFAMAAIDATGDVLIDEENPKRGHVRIRVGLHSGPVVTNVIGSLNPRYGLFGDTVNTASRMESNSIANRIHCTEKSAMILQDQDPDIKIIKRGKVAVKGKGEMVCYWIGDPLAGKDVSESMSARNVSFEEEICDDKMVDSADFVEKIDKKEHKKPAQKKEERKEKDGSGILKKKVKA